VNLAQIQVPLAGNGTDTASRRALDTLRERIVPATLGKIPGGEALTGTTAPGAIESWVPLFVFVVLFGLSMDYNVFVVSRIREAHDRGLPTREAVSHGIRSTAGVVTSAAVIMVAVFAVFATLSLQQLKQLSIGLAIAVLLDATIVRAVLLPSIMTVLGERNWYQPHWLAGLRRSPGLANRGRPPDGPAPIRPTGDARPT
jgi:uncharacterized membrane protein YdfJ with MMPL/SSD domain